MNTLIISQLITTRNKHSSVSHHRTEQTSRAKERKYETAGLYITDVHSFTDCCVGNK